ncbi:platelet-derived growth factor beta polypeptide a isoform X2 [Chanos chanos]|nr:putative mediator of RNA polymerase II transcription subunit 26 isoform X2 [Chanos chanos]
MSSWVVLLLALTACLRFGSAKGDPLPSSLVELVMSSPVSSTEDLQRLLDVDSVEDESDDQAANEIHSNSTHKRLPRSLMAGVQPAQQAACKVRTEVMEVTRAMLDRRNANFLLWPPCVEVQRCSGCCNIRTMQCVPVVTEMRQLQMTKITFINRHPHYEKVIVPVEDHITCSCQTKAPAQAPKPAAPKAQSTPPPPPPRHLPKPPQTKSQSKEELHRHDDLKQNQRFHLEDRETQELQWESKYTLRHTQAEPVGPRLQTLTHTQGYRPGPHQNTLSNTPAGSSYASREEVPTRQTSFGVTQMLSDTTQTQIGSGDENAKQMPREDQQQQQQQQQHYHQQHVGPSERYLQQDGTQQSVHKTTNNFSQSGVTNQPQRQLEIPDHDHSQAKVTSHPHSQSKEPNHHHDQSGDTKHDFGQSGMMNHQRNEGEPRIQPTLSEEELIQREKLAQIQRRLDYERRQLEHHHYHRHHHYHHQNHPTQGQSPQEMSLQRTVTDAPPALPPPSLPPTARNPPQTPLPRRRRRKHRRRISKASMRAMIM